MSTLIGKPKFILYCLLSWLHILDFLLAFNSFYLHLWSLIYRGCFLLDLDTFSSQRRLKNLSLTFRLLYRLDRLRWVICKGFFLSGGYSCSLLARRSGCRGWSRGALILCSHGCGRCLSDCRSLVTERASGLGCIRWARSNNRSLISRWTSVLCYHRGWSNSSLSVSGRAPVFDGIRTGCHFSAGPGRASVLHGAWFGEFFTWFALTNHMLATFLIDHVGRGRSRSGRSGGFTSARRSFSDWGTSFGWALITSLFRFTLTSPLLWRRIRDINSILSVALSLLAACRNNLFNLL